MSDLIKRSDAWKAFISKVDDMCDLEEVEEILESVPTADRPQGEVDAIDRDALIDYCLKLIDVERKQGSDVMNYGQERVNQTEAIIDYIEHMPHVNADRPREIGHWKNYKDEHCCSVCGEVVIDDWYSDDDWYNFCPNCGAEMRGADDE